MKLIVSLGIIYINLYYTSDLEDQIDDEKDVRNHLVNNDSDIKDELEKKEYFKEVVVARLNDKLM
ncbi:unnamed protein product [Paramecium octaurelia]|uniref:Uncharacterized protein n=1 Tax=Paramecium octaurelia TaxID=43137 RepID=A0A8S1WMB0_PAROT|nr:unnamed protein product [Paramecium octaurelia]